MNILKEENKKESTVYIFIGRSGCGKGTQVKLFKEKFDIKNDKIIHIESGSLLRDFISGDSHTQKLIRENINSGDLVPESVIICLWQQYLINNFTGSEKIIFDGAPRRLLEANILDNTLKFYNISKYKVIYINASIKWCTERLLGRGRKDDTKEGIVKRMEWYDEEVILSVNFFKNNKNCEFINVNGEQTIKEVHNEVMEKLNFNFN